MEIWAYENWQAYGGKRSLVFHLPECPSCNSGLGVHPGSGDENGRWVRFQSLTEAERWAADTEADLVRPCKRCLGADVAYGAASGAANLPGTYRVADGTPVEFSSAVRLWEQAARPVLLKVAGQYHTVINYQELAEAVQEATGVRTRMLISNWIGRALGAVSADCHKRDEPMLSALCVHADGSVGPGYGDAVVERYGGPVPRDLDQHAAEERLKCHKYFGAELPPDGGRPALAPQVVARRAQASKRAAITTERTFCPRCHMMLPLTGQCDFCS